jgi:hypothetical protein
VYGEMISENTKVKRVRRKKLVAETDCTEEPEPEPEDKKKGKKKTNKEVKIIQSLHSSENIHAKNVNVILHLKCSLKEIEDYILSSHKWNGDSVAYNPCVPNEIVAFEPLLNLQPFVADEGDTQKSAYNNVYCSKCDCEMTNRTEACMDDLTQKVKQLKIQFYKNSLPENKKSDCFWCTYPYDNETCYILQHGSNGDILGHGSFCSPECSVAYLFKYMHWDDSSKLEAYQLMNHYYGESSQFTDSIKPAASPFYFLEKYYGNLTIQEFRRLSKSPHMLLSVDKPVTRILPEIHEDNDKFIFNNQVGGTTPYRGTYKVKKQSEKNSGPSRNSILRDTFGLAQ